MLFELISNANRVCPDLRFKMPLTKGQLLTIHEHLLSLQERGNHFQLRYLGTKQGAQLLAQKLKAFNVKGAKIEQQSEGCYLIANKISKAILGGRLGADLSKFAKKPEVTSLTLLHGNTYATYDFRLDPASQLNEYLREPGHLYFVSYNRVLEGIWNCLENAEHLATLASRKEPRVAIPFIAYALEELGKATLIISSTANARDQGLSAAVVKGFRDHHHKLDCIISELLGHWRVKDPQTKLSEEDPGVWTEIRKRRGGFDVEEDLLIWHNPSLIRFLTGLAEFGSLERDRCIYIDYNRQARDWGKPTPQINSESCEAAVSLVLLLVGLFKRKITGLTSLPKRIRKLTDLISDSV